uniref:Uncharacterized protein n=1 Tax=Rhizophora mucronata TaxID=61149 RepID=A0A2P2Q2C1_RHIMU
MSNHNYSSLVPVIQIRRL